MTNTTDTLMIKYPREATIFASICAILFCIFGIIGNFITILALIRCSKLRAHATTAFVLSLCISDLLFCSVNLPLTASRYINERWTLGEGLCKLFPVLFYGNVAVSLLNMVAITLNRYILISYNHYYNKVYSPASIWLQLVCTWGFAFLIMLPSLLEVWGQLGLDEATFSCTILAKDGKSPKKVLFLIAFVLPCVVIIFAYSCIFWRVYTSKRKLKAHRKTSSGERAKSRRDRDDGRLTKLMLIIFICFVLCFLPLMLVNVFDDQVNFPIFHVFASILAWASSVINPFIYAASNRQYRSAYSNLLRRVKSSVVSESRAASNASTTKGRETRNGQTVNYKPNVGI